MAARMRKTHQEDVRSKIQASALIGRLTKHVEGEIELSPTQVRAAEILLKKTLPDLGSVEMTGDPDQPLHVTTKIERVIVDNSKA